MNEKIDYKKLRDYVMSAMSVEDMVSAFSAYEEGKMEGFINTVLKSYYSNAADVSDNTRKIFIASSSNEGVEQQIIINADCIFDVNPDCATFVWSVVEYMKDAIQSKGEDDIDGDEQLSVISCKEDTAQS